MSPNTTEKLIVIGSLMPGATYDFEVFVTATKGGIELSREVPSHSIITLSGRNFPPLKISKLQQICPLTNLDVLC